MFGRWRRTVPQVDGLEAKERVLSHADTAGGAIIATDRRLIWADGSIAWHEIDTAAWDGEEHVLRVEPVATSPHRSAYRLPIGEPGRVVDVVREQVIASVVISRHLPLRGKRGVRVTGRRKADGELVWSAVVDGGIDPEDPPTRAKLDAAVALVRNEVE